MRLLLLAGVLTAACTQHPGVPAGACRATIARMVPPQVVVDTMIAGARPQPSRIPTRDEYAARGNWIGNDAVWISLPADGTLSVHKESSAQNPEQPWGTKLWTIPLLGGTPKITAQRLDGNGTFVGTGSDGNIGSGVSFSDPGCWEITYELAGHQVRFTVNVAPQS